MFPSGEHEKGLFRLAVGLMGHVFVEFGEILFYEPGRVENGHIRDHGSLDTLLQKFGFCPFIEIVGGLQEELFNLKFQHGPNQLENSMRLRHTKKDVARIKTIMRPKELAAAGK